MRAAVDYKYHQASSHKVVKKGIRTQKALKKINEDGYLAPAVFAEGGQTHYRLFTNGFGDQSAIANVRVRYYMSFQQITV